MYKSSGNASGSEPLSPIKSLMGISAGICARRGRGADAGGEGESIDLRVRGWARLEAGWTTLDALCAALPRTILDVRDVNTRKFSYILSPIITTYVNLFPTEGKPITWEI